jgi:hypothetical protein
MPMVFQEALAYVNHGQNSVKDNRILKIWRGNPTR